jgi:ABC-type branched-subunit amino acid transport system ATPase component
MARPKSEGLSIVLVEQNLRLALGLTDDIAIFDCGRVMFPRHDRCAQGK